jgi:ABC-2 type transport system permease protein
MTMSRGVGATTARELRRMGSRPLYVLMIVILPLLSFVLLWAIFAGEVPRDLPIAVCDKDHSALSRKVVRLLDASAGLAVTQEVADAETGHSLIRQGKVYALILLPEHLERDGLAGKAPSVISYYNNEFLLPGSLANRDIRSVMTAVSAGIDIRVKQSQSGTVRLNAGAVEPIRIDQRQLFNPYLNYTYFLVAALLPTLLQIFVLVIVVYALGSELKEGSAPEWLALSGGSFWKAILGKLLPYVVSFSVIALAMVAFIFGFMGVPMKGRASLILVATIFFVIDYIVIGLFIVSMTANLRLSLNFSAFYATTAFTFVGVTFPTIGLPWIAKTWAAIIPLSYYLKVLFDQGIRGAPAIGAVIPLSIMAAFIPLLSVLPMLTMPRFMTLEKYWGRS